MHQKGADVCKELPAFSPDTSVLKLLLESLARNRNKVAQIEAATGKRCTFADILEQSKSICMGLRRTGIGSGDFVVICSGKSSLAFTIQLAIMFTGATPVLIDVKYSNEIHKLVKGHDIKAVFCEQSNLHLVEESFRLCGETCFRPTFISTTDINDKTFKTLLQPSEEFLLFEVENIKRHVVLVLFSSGSTSDPKGVQISDLALQRLGYSFVDESVQSYLLVNSFAWISSTISLVSSILKGYGLVLTDNKEPALLLRLVEKYRVEGWTASSSGISIYSKEAISNPVDLSSLKVVNVGGAVIKKRTIETFISDALKGRVGIQVIYGMTEIGIVTTWRGKDLLDLSKADSAGFLAPGVEVKITDELGRLVETGNIGEIRVKSISMMTGYWGRHELTEASFDSEGFFKTGDAGYFDNDGFLYIAGRASDIVTHGGSKVFVSQIEDLLKCHSAVLDAAVVARALPSDTNNLYTFLVVKPGCDVSKQDVSLFVSEQLGENIRFEDIHKVEAIPRTHSGKLHRGVLHNMMDKLYAQ